MTSYAAKNDAADGVAMVVWIFVVALAALGVLAFRAGRWGVRSLIAWKRARA
jgi:hypothetical protein